MIRVIEYERKALKAWLVGAVLVLLSGVWYRLLAGRYGREHFAELPPAVHLASPPKQVGHWQRVEESSGQVDGNTVSGTYRHDELNGATVEIFLVCTSYPPDMVEHRPRVCYEGNGWVHEQTESIEVTSELGREIPCNVHQFHRSAGDYERLVALVFYVVNGRVVSDEDAFSGSGWRNSGSVSGPGWYMAQVQISSNCESSVVLAARSLADAVLDMLPDEQGLVKETAGSANTLSRL